MDKADIHYPDIAWGTHLLEYFDDIPSVSWAELAAYMKLTGIEIPPGECAILVSLGRSQEAMHQEALKPDCPAPYVSVVSSDEERSAELVSSFFGRFKAK